MAPQRVHQLIARDQRRRALDQMAQQAIRLRAQADHTGRADEQFTLGVEFELGKAIAHRRSLTRSLRPSLPGFPAGQRQFASVSGARLDQFLMSC